MNYLIIQGFLELLTKSIGIRLHQASYSSSLPFVPGGGPLLWIIDVIYLDCMYGQRRQSSGRCATYVTNATPAFLSAFLGDQACKRSPLLSHQWQWHVTRGRTRVRVVDAIFFWMRQRRIAF